MVKPYDSTSTSAGGSALSDGQSTEMVFMKEFLNFMKESGTEVPERFQKFMPNDKMADIRLQQKKLNKQRNVAQKIDNKRKAIERDAEQWTQWLVKMREEIQAEKDKHIANQERLNKELEQLLEEQKNLAKDDDVEEVTKTEEMEVEDSLEALLQTDVSTEPNVQQIQPVVNKIIAEMHDKMEQEYVRKIETERQKMKLELANYIQALNVKPGEGATEILELSDTEHTDEVKEVRNTNTKLEGLGLVAGSLAAAAVAPFGVQRIRQRNVSSPYGPKKTTSEEKQTEEGAQTMEEVLMMNTSKKEQPPDTGQ